MNTQLQVYRDKGWLGDGLANSEFNAKPLANCWLYRDELMRGGRLVFTVGPQPNETWGTKPPRPSA